MRLVPGLLFVSILLAGCATSRMPATLSEAVYVAMDPVDVKGTVTFTSRVPDDSIEVRFLYPDGRPYSSGTKWKIQQNDAMRQMVKEYSLAKFSPSARKHIKVKLTVDAIDPVYQKHQGIGKTLLVAFLGGELDATVSCKHMGSVVVEDSTTNRVLIRKRVIGSASDEDVQGFGTGTQTSYRWKGKDKAELIMARVCNASFNRLLMQMDRAIDQALLVDTKR